MNFQVGDKIVYPNHGVGIVEQINKMNAGVAPQRFYLLKIHSNSLRVMVPYANVNAVGLRHIVKTREVRQILNYLSQGECENHKDWKYRFKENSEKMRTGCLLQVAEVLKSLLVISRAKELSFRERRMLDRARYLVISELAVAKSTSEEAAQTLLTKALAKAQLKLMPGSTEMSASV